MNIEEIREHCIAKAGVEETIPFGPDILVYKVMGKVFLLCGLDNTPLQFNVKCDPELAIDLRERFPCVIPGYHMNKKHWNTIICDGSVSGKLVREWIDHSYELIVASLPKKDKAALESPKNKKAR